MFYFFFGVNDDFMVVEVKYYKNCYLFYIVKKVRDDKGESSNEWYYENVFK